MNNTQVCLRSCQHEDTHGSPYTTAPFARCQGIAVAPVIAALGYRPRALPVLDEAGRAVRLHSLTGPRAPLVYGQCRVKFLCESLTMSALLSLLLLMQAGCGLTVNDPASFDGPTGTTAALDSGVPIQGHVGSEQW